MLMENRLDRIEEKLDKLSDAIVSLARMEERHKTIFNRMDSMEKYFKALDERMDRIEIVSAKRGQTIAFAERLFWIVIAALVGTMFFLYRNI